MRKTVAAIIASVAFVGALETPAHSAWGTWDRIGTWHIKGESQAQMCMATNAYDSGIVMGIVFSKAGASLSFYNVEGSPNTGYDLLVMTSTGVTGTFHGQTDGAGDFISFDGLNETSVRELRVAQSIAIRGIGHFDLTGSAKAMVSAGECFEALSSI